MLLKNSFSKKKWMTSFLSIGFSFVFVYIIPWDNLKEFNDIENYIKRIVYLVDGGAEYEYKGISVISSEYLWKYILIYLSSIDFFDNNYRAILQIISFASLFIYTQFALKRIRFIFFLLLVFNPLFMHLIIEQIRIALAFSLLLVIYEYRNIKWIYILLPACILIHTASLLLVFIYVLLEVFIRLLNKNKVYVYALIASFMLAIFLKFGVDAVLGFLGDRRANASVRTSSLLFSFFWLFNGLVLTLYCKRNHVDLIRIASYSIFMMGLFFSSSLLGSYGQRYVAISFPLIIISIRGIKNYHVKFISVFLFIIYNLLSWFYWFKLFNYL